MDENKMIESLYAMIHAALMEIAKDRPNLKTPQVSETLRNLLDAKCILEEQMESGYSGAGHWAAEGGYSRDGYDSGSSNANRRHWVSGHYSRGYDPGPTWDEMISKASPNQRAMLEDMRSRM